MRHDSKHSGLVSKTSADLYAQTLEMYSSQTRFVLKILGHNWFRPIAKLIERITIPGILLHYVLRKRCIARLARSALINGVTQVVVIGAGFDPLSFELHENFRGVRLWEIDHPATQRYKVSAFPKIGSERLHFIAVDLKAAALDGEVLIKNGFDPAQRTFWMAEGLLMYLPADIVCSLMGTLKGLSASSSQFAFTFMEKWSNGRIRFHSQSKLVDWWLRGRSEPFIWGTTRGEVVDLVRPWRVIRFFDHSDLRDVESGLADEAIARGEVICLAQS
jgi:methyltransferase (TIGR00027 family)